MTSLQHFLGSTISLMWARNDRVLRNRSQVLMYHSIGGNANDDVRGLYSVSPTAFRNQIRILSDLVSENQFVIVPFGSEHPGSISITFDDGYLDNLTIAAPLFAEYGFPFHVFLCPTFVESGRSEFLSRADVQELAALDGATLGVHGYSHTPLTTLDVADAKNELSSSRRWLEDLVQKPVTSMSYPHGAVNSKISTSAGEVGFTRAASSKFGPINSEQDPLNIPRIDIWSSDTNSSFKAKVEGKWDWMKWRT